MTVRTKALIALLLATFFGATNGAVVKILLQTYDPFVVAFFRFGLATLIIVPWFFSTRPKHLLTSIRNTLPIAVLSTANICLFFVALTKTTANATSIIYAATPILTAIMAPMLIGEKISKQKIAGIIVGLFGVLLILILPSINKTHLLVGDTVGNILVFVAACSWALYTIGSRHLIDKKQQTPMSLSAISISLTALVTLVFSFTRSTIDVPSVLTHPQTLLLVLYLATCTTIGMYVFYQYAVKHLSATTASMSNYVGPVFAFSINAVILGETLTTGFLIGTCFVFAGTYLATSARAGHLARRIRQGLG